MKIQFLFIFLLSFFAPKFLTAESWSNISPAGISPTARIGHSSIFDAPNQRLIMFGGFDVASRNDLWALNLSGPPSWSQLLPIGVSPTARYGQTTIYDSLNQRIILFGGNDGSRKNDVWSLPLTGPVAWSLISPAGGPPTGRDYNSAIYDSANQQMVIFGGGGGGVIRFNDVWTLSLSGSPTWTQLTPSCPCPVSRVAHIAAYEPTGQRMVIFGGSSSATYLNDVWTLNLVGPPVWNQVTAIGVSPTARYYHTAVADNANSRIVVFGGYDGGYKNDVWSLPFSALNQWSQIFPTGGPPAGRFNLTSAFDSINLKIVIHGGSNLTGLKGDVWALDVAPTPTSTITSTFTVSPTITLTSTFTVTPTMTSTFSFSPTLTISRTPSSTLTPSATRSMTKTPSPTPTQTATKTPVFSPTPYISPTPAPPAPAVGQIYSFPDPAPGGKCSFAVTMEEAGVLDLKVRKVNGTILFTRDFTLAVGTSILPVDLGETIPGVYFVQATFTYSSGRVVNPKTFKVRVIP